MKSAFPIFVAAVLLFSISGAQARTAGRAMGNSNIKLAAPPPVSVAPLAPPPLSSTLNPGAIANPQRPFTPQVNPGLTGSVTNNTLNSQFGASPGNPGSPTFDPNAGLPSLGNQGSATPGTSAAGVNTFPSTSSGM